MISTLRILFYIDWHLACKVVLITNQREKMKKLITLFSILFCFNSFAFTVVDSMYGTSQYELFASRLPASQEGAYCLVTQDQKSFAKSCYSSKELCAKRLEFWKDLPGAKNHSCAKI